MPAVRFQLPASSTTKEAFIAAIKEMAARAIAAERERERGRGGAASALGGGAGDLARRSAAEGGTRLPVS